MEALSTVKKNEKLVSELAVKDEFELDEATLERERQRSESEARDIIHDVGRIYTFPEERKTRWIWELLQNAKDVAGPEGVDITVRLTDNQLIFSHNGLPFATRHLLAILYKTSTKSLDGEGGTTGKYGTGFVTTHILNRKLRITGIHENITGKRKFEIEIDRSAANLDEGIALQAMQHSLAVSFGDINRISKMPQEEVQTIFHSFTYELTPSSYIYAERGLKELEQNIAFTLLINQGPVKKIKSITIEMLGYTKRYEAAPSLTFMDEIQFISSGEESGILCYISDKLIFGIPAKTRNNSYQLLPINNQAILFKEFPLIGTENFHLPVFIQHIDFHPTELRDGIRTKKEIEAEADPIADKNRKALVEFVNAYIPFIQKIIKNDLEGIYHLAQSGLPQFIEDYSNSSWYKVNIQHPIRQEILKHNIVKNCLGKLIKIDQTIFPTSEHTDDPEFYTLLSKLLPGKVSDNNSISAWAKIISQETDSWDIGNTINVEGLVKLMPENILVGEERSYTWLKDLYRYLEEKNLTYLGETYCIYLSEAGKFCIRDKVRTHPIIDNEFKIVSKGLGRDLDEEFLNRKLGNVSSVKPFELAEFYNWINKTISELKPEQPNIEERIRAIFKICCLFRSDKAAKRDLWFSVINELLPNLAQEKIKVSVDYEYYYRSAELWSIKYIAHLLETSQKPSIFATSYFEGHNKSCFDWLKKYLSYVFDLKEDNSEVILKKRIIPTQADNFKPYDDFIYAELNHKYFDDTIKNIYRDYTGKGDPRQFMIDAKIDFDGLRTKDINILTDEIDKLFDDINIESKIKNDDSQKEMFLKINDWFEQFPNTNQYLKTFASKRAILYVIALGEGFSKQIMEMKNSGKSMEDIAELAKIKLSPEVLKKFEEAAEILGADNLLKKANDMLEAKWQIERWKKIGDAAEDAFKDAIIGIDMGCQIGNPDKGLDYELIINTKGYSIEIKNVAEGKENVRMSILQGRTAVSLKDSYALCVMTRPQDESVPIDKDYFMENARFVTNIGYQIGDKIAHWDAGLVQLSSKEDIRVNLDDKTEHLYVNRPIWREGISFDKFIIKLKEFFAINENNTAKEP